MSPDVPPRTGAPGGTSLFDAAWTMPRWLGLGVDALVSRMARAFVGGPGEPPPPAAGRVGGPGGADRQPAVSAAPSAGGEGCYGGAPRDLTRDERSALDSAEIYLERGLELKRWWERAHASGCFAQRFPLSTSYNRPDESFGFFDVARVGGREMPIMGNYQTLFYDQPKSPTADRGAAARWMRDQVREFVLRYFMRISYFRQPEAYVPAGDRHPPPLLLRPFSLCPEEDPAFVGFGFSQLLFKRSDDGEIGAFPDVDRYALVDLREIGPKYRWTMLQVDIFDFNFAYQPFGPGTPSLTFPLTEGSYLIMDRTFVVDEDKPSPEVLGRYGFGYAFIKNLTPGLIAYGPGEFEAAIELITFTVFRDGRVRAEAAFVANRPLQIAHLPLNPLIWADLAVRLASFGTAPYFLGPLRDALRRLPLAGYGFDPVSAAVALANAASGGLAAQNLCLSKEQLEIIFLVKHFMQHYQTLEGSLQTWRQIPDWLDAKNLPDWVVTGRAGE